MQYMQNKVVRDAGMRNKEQHEGEDKGWACNNCNMRNSSLYFLYGVTHVMIVA